MSDTAWFLQDDLGDVEVDIMPEGGDFSPTGFYGLLQIHHLWRLYLEVEPSVLEGEEVAFDTYRQMGPGYLYLFEDYDEAVAAQDAVGAEIKPAKIFYPEMPIETVFSFRDQEAKDKWGSSINGEIRKNTLVSGYRGETHLVFIPAFVHAFAKAKGWSVPAPDFSAIDVARDEFPATDELQMQLIGNAKRGKKGEYKDSQYYQYRAALWAALGEPNPEAVHPKGTQVTRGGKLVVSDLATTSDKLSLAFTVLGSKWKEPIWARTKHLCNPRVGAESNSGKRLTICTVLDLYKDEAVAHAAYEAEMAELGISLEEEAESSGATTSVGDSVPENWAEMADDWWKEIDDLIAKGSEGTREDANALDVSLPVLRRAITSRK